jgi:ribosomal protein L40E
MLRCTKCDTINPSDAVLCSNCSSLLQWTGVPVDPSELVPEPDPGGVEHEAEASATPESSSASDALSPEAAEQERLTAEAEAATRAAEEARITAEAKAAEDAKAEEAKLAADEARVAAEAKAADEARLAAEAQTRAADDARIAAEAKANDEARAADEASSAETVSGDESRLSAEGKATYLGRLAAEAKTAEDARVAEAKAAEEAKLAADAKAAEEERLATEAKAAQEARIAAEAKATEEARVAAEAKAAQDARVEAEAKAAEDARVASEARAAEDARIAAEARAADEARLAAEARAADEARLAAEAKAAEEARLAAEANAAEELRLAAEARAAEQARLVAADDQPPSARPGKRSDEPPSRHPSPPDPAEDDQPEARKPQLDIAPRPRPMPEPPPPPELPEAAPGDIICRRCGTPNGPGRSFCRKCGNPLAAEAPPPPSVPWYRRIFARSVPTNVAGDRPKRLGQEGQPRPGPLRRAIPFVLIAVLAFGITSVVVAPGVRDFLGGVVTDLRLRFLPEISDIHPVNVQGAGVGSNTGKLAIDNNTKTFWLADPALGDPTVTAGLDSTINLGGLVVHSGSSTATDFTSHRRPKTLELTFPGTDQPPVQVTLKDVAEPQPLAIDVRGIKTVAFRVVDWFEAAAGGDKLVAIREIELKQRR